MARDKTNIRILKNRITGKLGLVCAENGEKETLYFIENTGRMVTTGQIMGNV